MASANPPPEAPSFVPPPHVYEAGDTIGGKYLLEALVGEGGMGTVWRARNLALEVVVAVKLVAGTSDLELLRARLVREAKTAARLRHPAIVQIFDVGETAQGDPFIVMEFLEGDTLGALLEDSVRLPAAEAVRLLLPIADALHAAHTRGLVHRDVKPDNVFIVRDDGQLRPKLVDFGIVKVEGGKEHHAQITERGTFVGTPAYMSPEQARGHEDLDRSTDIWAFAITLFECVSGVVPFSAENYNALLRAIVEDPLPPLSAYGIQDQRLAAIIATGLAKDPKRRWSSMRAFAAALSSWLAEQEPGAEASEALRKRRTLAQPSARPGSLGSALLPTISVIDLDPIKRQRWFVAAGVAGAAILAAVFWLVRAQPAASASASGQSGTAPSVAAASHGGAPDVKPLVVPVPSAAPLPVDSAPPLERARPVERARGVESTTAPSASVTRPLPAVRDSPARPKKPARDPGRQLDLMEPF